MMWILLRKLREKEEIKRERRFHAKAPSLRKVAKKNLAPFVFQLSVFA